LQAVILIREQTWLICALLTEMWIVSRCTLGEPKFQHFPTRYDPRPPYKCKLHMQCTTLPSKFLPLCTDNLLCHSPCI